MSKYSLVSDSQFGYKKIFPTPTPEEISDYYAKEFYSSHYGKLNDSSNEVQELDKEYYDSRWQDILDNLSSIIGDVNGKSVLDVGCGWGQALLYFKNKGLTCYGFDPAVDAIMFAQKRGLNVQVAGMDTIDVFKRKFDVVTLINVLEHLAEPDKVLREIRSTVLNPDGCLVIDVPNEFNTFQTIANEEFNLNNWWVVPPAHLNYFTPVTLSNLLEGCGFDVKISESSFPLEMFMLFGDVYVGDSALGRKCHEKRMSFEKLMRKYGHEKKLKEFYRALAKLELGRQFTIYATPKK